MLQRHCDAPVPSIQAAPPGPAPTNAGIDDFNLSTSTPSACLTSTLRDKAISTAVHAGLRGPAARVAGAAAAIGFEGYGLYQELNEHGERLQENLISAGQYKDKVCESTVTSSGRAIGGLAGAAAGQVAIPVPVVGAVVGGLVGAAAGGLHASSLIRGAIRLSGGKQKGGDDLVRCVEHLPQEGGSDLPQPTTHSQGDAARSACMDSHPSEAPLCDEEALL